MESFIGLDNHTEEIRQHRVWETVMINHKIMVTIVGCT
jgi:hypothetical protein